MTELRHLGAALLLLAAATQTPVLAQKLAPGLWEHSVTMKTASGAVEAGMAQMQERLAAMPPEKRKQVEDMMARQGMTMGAGAGAGGGAGQAMVVKVCLTPEQAALDRLPPPDSNCKQTRQQREGKTLRFAFECSGERQGKGEGEYTLDSDKAHHGRTTIDVLARGKPERMEMQHKARWLAADCGTVKPRP